MNQDTKAALQNILDTFSGADGGVAFVQLRGLIEDMCERESNGDKDATEVINIMMRFNNLINFAKNNY